MRYISKHDNHVLYETNGFDVAYNATNGKEYRWKYGVLIVGNATAVDKTVDGNFIDASAVIAAPGTQLQLLGGGYAKDLDGYAVSRIEMCGQGSLNGKTATDGTADLWNCVRDFYPAPVLSTGASTVVDTEGVFYEVLTGTVTYDSVVYSAGEVFAAVKSVTTTSGTGTFALTFPPAGCTVDRTCLFKQEQLAEGDEVDGYFSWDDGGYTPNDSQVSTAANFHGRLHPYIKE